MREHAAETTRSGHFSNRELLRLLWPMFRPYVKHLGGAFLLLICLSLLLIAGPILVKRAIDLDIANQDYAGLKFTVMLYLGAQMLHLFILYIMRNWLEWTGQQMMAGLRKNLVNHLIDLPLSFHDRKTPGELLNRVESDTQALRMLFTTTAVMLVGDLLLFIGMFVAMGLVSIRLTLVTAAIVPVLVLVTIFFQRRIHPIFVEVRRQNSKISSRLTEFLQAIPVIQAFERQRWALRTFIEMDHEKYHTRVPGEKNVVLWFNLIFMLQTMAFAMILGLGGYWALSGLVTIGTLVMFVGFVRRFFEPLLRLSEQLTVIQRAFASAERIFVLLKEPVTILDPETPVACPEVTESVEFDRVSFRYQENSDWIVKDLTFRIPAGEHWALVGPTGAGKTTLINLLLRFYQPNEGEIRIDGVPISDLIQEELRQQIGMVQQDIYLFPGNLTANLTMGKEFTSEHVEETARTTLTHKYIEKLPGGYQSELAERGINLSLGQRQLLSLTRALLHDPKLIILDEATSAIDPATEAAIVEATRRLLEGRTALIIAHRLSTIRHCDRILVLQHGELIQQGTYNELLAEAGLFRTMHELQFAGNGDSSVAATDDREVV